MSFRRQDSSQVLGEEGPDDIEGDCVAGSQDLLHLNTSLPRRTRTPGGGSSSLAAICHLCEEPGACIQWRGVWLHKGRCHAAVRARGRQVKNTKVADEDLKDIRGNTERWRNKVMPFFGAESNLERQLAREDARAETISVNQDVKIDVNKRVTPKLVLTRQRFKAHRQFWDKAGSDTCDEDFDDLHQSQAGEHDVEGQNGEPIQRVATEGNPELVQESGRQQMVGTVTTRDLPSSSGDVAPPRRVSSRENMTPRLGSGGRGVSAGSAAASTLVGSLREQAAAFVAAAAGDEQSLHNYAKRRRVGDAQGEEATTNLGVDDDDRRSTLAATDAVVAGPGLRYLQEKEAAKNLAASLSARLVGGKGLQTRLNKDYSEFKRKGGDLETRNDD